MKQTITLLIVLITCAISFSQNANLDREYFKVSYVKLPAKPILDDSKRTYSSNKRAISLSGFSRVKTNGTLDINYTFNGTKVGDVEIKKTKHEKKDKDGKVTSVSYTYKVHNSYNSTANLSISNSYNLEDNFEKTYSEGDEYTSSSYDSYKKAQDYYNNNKYTIRNDHASKQKERILGSINGSLNIIYGYVPSTRTNEQFWILGNKKHPEYQKHIEAYNKMKVVFEKMQFDQPVEALHAELQPIIDYFNGLIPQYVGDKKKMAKMRYASYYNIAKMYYFLDMPEKTKEYAQKLIDNGYDKSDGKNFIRIADNLLEKFKINDTNSRHFEVVTEDLTNLVDEPETDSQSGMSSTSIELVKAYLISKAGDTTLVDMEPKNIRQIAYEVKTVKYSDNSTPVGTDVRSAKKFNEVLFIDGTHYKNINFRESAIKGDAVSGTDLLKGASDKLCKVLFESDKINLYQFNNEESVILLPGEEKGKSTMSTKFVFGFKKNLSKLAEGCSDLLEEVNKKTYKNTKEDLIKFCETLTSCK